MNLEDALLKVRDSATIIEGLQTAQQGSRQEFDQKIAQLHDEISQLKECGSQVTSPFDLSLLQYQKVSWESTTTELRQQLLQQQVGHLILSFLTFLLGHRSKKQERLCDPLNRPGRTNS